jgi:predicted RNase H-like nuclease (RuvC/YqgF family)
VEQKNSKIFNNQTMQTVSAYCSANNIEDIDDFIYKCFKQGFDIKKYGLLGKTLNEGEKDLKTGGIEEKQVIKEVIVEKVVIKEVPVEVVVEKIIKTVDDTQVNELLLKIQQLEQEISTKTEERENIFQNTDNNKLQMLQQTIQNLTSEVRDLKKNNEELKKQLLEKPIESDFTRARFHGGSNLNDGLYK